MSAMAVFGGKCPGGKFPVTEPVCRLGAADSGWYRSVAETDIGIVVDTVAGRRPPRCFLSSERASERDVCNVISA